MRFLHILREEIVEEKSDNAEADLKRNVLRVRISWDLNRVRIRDVHSLFKFCLKVISGLFWDNIRKHSINEWECVIWIKILHHSEWGAELLCHSKSSSLRRVLTELHNNFHHHKLPFEGLFLMIRPICDSDWRYTQTILQHDWDLQNWRLLSEYELSLLWYCYDHTVI